MNALTKRLPNLPPSGGSIELLSADERKKGNQDLKTKQDIRVEPKTYFANERTFIQWISAALLLLTVSSILVGNGGYNTTSSVIAFGAFVLVCYSSFVYFRRVKLLKSGTSYGYLDFLGPCILAIGVGVGIFIVFADAVKGSEFLSFGQKESEGKYSAGRYRDGNRRLQSAEPRGLTMSIQQEPGKCFQTPITGINLLEYQPRDLIKGEKDQLIVASSQSLVSHYFSVAPDLNEQATVSSASRALSEIPDIELQSVALVGERLIALSTGPTQTELIEFESSLGDDDTLEIKSRLIIQESPTSNGSMVYDDAQGRLYIVIDGTMHAYQIANQSLTRVNTINMKVINRGVEFGEDGQITGMEHFEGVTYLLRGGLNVIHAWDMESATFLAEIFLPDVGQDKDKWVGMALERRDMVQVEGSLALRGKKTDRNGETSAVFMHLSLDAFPPQLWSFRLEESLGANHIATFKLPECGTIFEEPPF
mmetsp:Transcript_11628/g.18653  ORF Transcript_11628/g.18653 Transcript_11628/m.18653 type:complete len:479 (+) Transcript_11628:73-1509(+)